MLCRDFCHRASGIVVACLASVVGGLGNGVQWVALLTAVQELVPDAMQARVSGFLESLSAAMPGVGFLLGGVIAFVLDAVAADVGDAPRAVDVIDALPGRARSADQHCRNRPGPAPFGSGQSAQSLGV